MTRMTGKSMHNLPGPVAPKCLVCTTPVRCGTVALHTQGPRCAGKADGPDDCDCLNACGDDQWLETGRSMPCEHWREAKARLALAAAPQPPVEGREPFGYVNTHTGQFFKDVEPSRKNNQGHWRTVYTAPAPADAEPLQ